MDTIDRYMEKESIKHVDFVKVDVEGEELGFFKGATKLLEMRSIFMCELQPNISRNVKSVENYLVERGYIWHAIREDGSLFKSTSIIDNKAVQDFIAIPI